MDKASWALVLSGAAIVVAVSGIVVAAIIANRANRLQERVTVIEEDRRSEELEARGRANVHARRDPPGRPDSLVLSVTGDTSARDLVVKVGPASLLLGEPTSFSSIDPEQVVRLHLAITRDDFPPDAPRLVRLHLRWQDDRGTQTKDLTLTV